MAPFFFEGDPKCPVASFEKYISKLNPLLDVLWQRPLDTFLPKESTWYYAAPVGKNTLGNMMPALSKLAKLSKRYTNHSIRATSVTLLDRAGYESRHIMKVSGHRSENSLKSYAQHIPESTTMGMSSAISKSLSNQSLDKQDLLNETRATIPLQAQPRIFRPIYPSRIPVATATNSQYNHTSINMAPPRLPTFAGCHIENITFHYNN